jgi:hypothetical protein
MRYGSQFVAPIIYYFYNKFIKHFQSFIPPKVLVGDLSVK